MTSLRMMKLVVVRVEMTVEGAISLVFELEEVVEC
jgi:hypothetical protein